MLNHSTSMALTRTIGSCNPNGLMIIWVIVKYRFNGFIQQTIELGIRNKSFPIFRTLFTYIIYRSRLAQGNDVIIFTCHSLYFNCSSVSRRNLLSIVYTLHELRGIEANPKESGLDRRSLIHF